MKTQLYTTKCKEIDIKPPIGGFIYENDESDLVIGFITNFNETNNTLTICLFEPRFVNVEECIDFESINVELTNDELLEYMAHMLNSATDDIKQLWVETVNEQIKNNQLY